MADNPRVTSKFDRGQKAGLPRTPGGVAHPGGTAKPTGGPGPAPVRHPGEALPVTGTTVAGHMESGHMHPRHIAAPTGEPVRHAYPLGESHPHATHTPATHHTDHLDHKHQQTVEGRPHEHESGKGRG